MSTWSFIQRTDNNSIFGFSFFWLWIKFVFSFYSGIQSVVCVVCIWKIYRWGAVGLHNTLRCYVFTIFTIECLAWTNEARWWANNEHVWYLFHFLSFTFSCLYFWFDHYLFLLSVHRRMWSSFNFDACAVDIPYMLLSAYDTLTTIYNTFIPIGMNTFVRYKAQSRWSLKIVSKSWSNWPHVCCTSTYIPVLHAQRKWKSKQILIFFFFVFSIPLRFISLFIWGLCACKIFDNEHHCIWYFRMNEKQDRNNKNWNEYVYFK